MENQDMNSLMKLLGWGQFSNTMDTQQSTNNVMNLGAYMENAKTLQALLMAAQNNPAIMQQMGPVIQQMQGFGDMFSQELTRNSPMGREQTARTQRDATNPFNQNQHAQEATGKYNSVMDQWADYHSRYNNILNNPGASVMAKDRIRNQMSYDQNNPLGIGWGGTPAYANADMGRAQTGYAAAPTTAEMNLQNRMDQAGETAKATVPRPPTINHAPIKQNNKGVYTQ